MGAVKIDDRILEKFSKKCKNIGLTNKQIAEFLIKKFLKGEIKYEFEYEK